MTSIIIRALTTEKHLGHQYSSTLANDTGQVSPNGRIDWFLQRAAHHVFARTGRRRRCSCHRLIHHHMTTIVIQLVHLIDIDDQIVVILTVIAIVHHHHQYTPNQYKGD